jgi:hypothetical protein
MPNWCNNSITIQGPTETIKQLWEDAHWTETVKDEDDKDVSVERFGLLQAMVPMPKELEGTTSPSDGPNWYDWRVNNWGTKWDIDSEGLEFTDNGDGTAMIDGWFESAWAPPTGAYDAFLNDMDNCDIEAWYHEPGMDFAGKYSNGSDETLSDLGTYARRVIESDESGSNLYDELDDHWDLTEQMREYIEEEIAEEKE